MSNDYVLLYILLGNDDVVKNENSIMWYDIETLIVSSHTLVMYKTGIFLQFTKK